ncbi:uncharacterized protein LOC132396924 isoform X8 [Hypanus sabinus]|uniref:uncharacterized protein LOC132396924 isoform X8 n=1 Tax=Hypanus sabinus TaxID=79690 RepID=UPI0028C4040A|nr:uncharacterized protein LOC132396924 isoform X8 [Hypanus sabinus]
MKDFEELRKLCCTDNPDGIKMTAASNGIEKDIKKGGNLILQTGKGILKLKKKKEVRENSSTVIKGQNGKSTGNLCLEMERKGQKNFALKGKSVLEQKLVKTCLDEGYVNKPGNINNMNTEEKAKHKTKSVGRTNKPNKEIPTLSDSQYEKLFQSVIDKTLEECIASCKRHEMQSFQDSELLLTSENIEPSINTEPSIEMQGVRRVKARAKDKKVNKLSRKNKIIIDINEASEVKKEGRKNKRKGQPKKIVPDYTRFIDDDEETTLEFSNQLSPSFIATSRSDTTKGSGSMEPSRGDNSHVMPAGNSNPWATAVAMREYQPEEEKEDKNVQDSPAQSTSRSLSRGTGEFGQHRNPVFEGHQLEGEVGDNLASKFLEIQQEGFHILHGDLVQLQETLGEGISGFSRKLAKRLVRISNQMSVLVELLHNINTALVPGSSDQFSVACQTTSKEVQDPFTHTTKEQVGPEFIKSIVPSPPFQSETLRKRRLSMTRSEDKSSKVVKVDV